MSMLQLDKVSKVYKSGTFGASLKPALRQVSFGIEGGEVFSLIGESGSGKSTMGKIILRLTPMSGGSVTFEGADVASLKKSELHGYYRRVQGVFQDPFSSYNPVYKADRVFEMLRQEYFSDLPGPQWRAKVDLALETVTLNPADVLNKFPHQLSGGQQQRLLVARALLLDVKLLIADEIISMLDASTRVDVLNMLVSLKKRGLGILFITHDLSLGNYISDKTVILRQGAIVEMGETAKVFGNPQHSYTRSLLVAVPQLHRKWEHVNGTVARSASASSLPNVHEPAYAAAGPGTGVAQEQEESKRYSKSPLNPARAARSPSGADNGSAGARPSLMDIPDAPWGRRVRPRHRSMAEVIADNAPPLLVEYEPGHLVALEE